jgi:hypothetical protein
MQSTANGNEKAPYAEAIRLMQGIAVGGDSQLTQGGILEPATNAFLEQNASIFELLRQGASSNSTQWDADTSDVRRLQEQRMAVSGLCRISILRARTSLALGEPIRGRDDLLSAMALVRNVTHGLPFRLVKTIELDDEAGLLRCMAELSPCLPEEGVRQLAVLLGQLPAAVSPGDTVCTDPQFYAMQLKRLPHPPPGLEEGLDSFSGFCKAAAEELDREPPLSPDDLERRLVNLATTIGPDVPAVGRTLTGQSVRVFAHFYSFVRFGREQMAMFQCGLAIIRDGPKAIRQSLDSHSNGAFNHIAADQGFEIQGTIISPCTGKPITLRFGTSSRKQN